LRDLSKAGAVFGEKRFSFFQAPFRIGGPARAILPTLTYAHILHNVGFEDAQQLATLTAAWRQLYELVKPDLIIFDHSPTALLAARGIIARKCIVGSGFFIPPDESPLPTLSPGHSGNLEELLRDETRILSTMNGVAKRWDQRPLERITQLYSEVDESFLLTFQELDHYPHRRPATYWGSWNNTAGAAPKWPSGSGKRIFAYLKSTPTAPDILRFLNELGKPTIAVMPEMDHSLRQHLDAPTLRIENHPLDLHAAARDCDLAILNGNYASTVCIMLGGKPTLQIPMYLEQTIFAKRVSALGAGLDVDPRKIHEVAGGLQRLLSQDRFTAAAREFAQQYCGFDVQAQLGRIIDRIERLVVRHTPAPEFH